MLKVIHLADRECVWQRRTATMARFSRWGNGVARQSKLVRAAGPIKGWLPRAKPMSPQGFR